MLGPHDKIAAAKHTDTYSSKQMTELTSPKRPNSGVQTCKEKYYHAFMTDFETSLLDGWDKPIPKGDKRHENPEWAKHVQAQVYPHHSDVDWWEYCFWVELGYGDEWFIKS